MDKIGKIYRDLDSIFVEDDLIAHPCSYIKQLYCVGNEIDGIFETLLNGIVKHVRQWDKKIIKATLDAMVEDVVYIHKG